MPKNLILCSDGTGNKGGTGSDTNVYRIYHAIKAASKDDPREQRTFYDDGVGTATNSVARAIGGATGVGFRANVRNLYEFAGRHYEDGDDIYAFGFSRGAATIRAFAGMVNHCGLVLRSASKDEEDFQSQIDAASRFYASRGSKFTVGALLDFFSRSKKYEGRKVRIEFLGVWDTVSALGFPQVPALDALANFFHRHDFHDLEPTPVVKNVLHAVAVDDERRTFWPLIWNENGFTSEQHIEQVWFPGMHSNVGGGYPRAGLANITLDWMITRLDMHRASFEDGSRGLRLEESFRLDVREGINASGKMMDSRGGFALMYRYQPRPITGLCEGKLRDDAPIQIHSSVVRRMELRTAGYTPGQIPGRFDVVESRGTERKPVDLGAQEGGAETRPWKPLRTKIDASIGSRITLYWIFLLTTIALVATSLVFWVSETQYPNPTDAWRDASWMNWFLAHVTDMLRYVLPDVFNNIVNYGFLAQPAWGAGFVGVAAVYWVLRAQFRKLSDRVLETARVFVLDRWAND